MTRFRTPLIMGLAVLLAVAMAVTSHAQPPQGGRGGMMGRGMGGGNPLMLLANDQVQEELKLTDDQKGKLRVMGEKAMAEMRERFSGMRDLSEEERRAKFAEMQKEGEQRNKQIEAQLKEVLTTEQSERLGQIRLQQQGMMAVGTPDVAKALGITEEQKEKLQAAGQEIQEKMRGMWQQVQDLEGEQRGQKMQQLSQEIGQAAEQKVKEILSTEQWETFQKMRGEPLKLERRGFGGQRPAGSAGRQRPEGSGDRERPGRGRPGQDRPERERPGRERPGQ